MGKRERSRAEPVLLQIATIDAVTNSEQHDTRELSYIWLSVDHHCTAKSPHNGFSGRCTLITTACNKTNCLDFLGADYLV